jgi:hypothetical protein
LRLLFLAPARGARRGVRTRAILLGIAPGGRRGRTRPMSSNPTSDTDPKIEAVLVAGYRAMSVSQKLARVTALTRAVQELALLDIRRRHPQADKREQALRLASRWLDADLMKRAFDWDVRAAGF